MNFSIAILILKMEWEKATFQHIMLYYFKKGKNTSEMKKKKKKKICEMYGEGAVTDYTCHKCFANFLGRFLTGQFSMVG